MQAALEAEITEFLGRDRYQRAAACEDARPGSRNGYREVTVKTTAGPVKLSRPKLRGTTEAFASRLFGSHVTKTNALESLVIASFARGLSVRDVEAALAEALGDRAAISKSTVSAICQQIKDEYEAWARRNAGELRSAGGCHALLAVCRCRRVPVADRGGDLCDPLAGAGFAGRVLVPAR